MKCTDSTQQRSLQNDFAAKEKKTQKTGIESRNLIRENEFLQVILLDHNGKCVSKNKKLKKKVLKKARYVQTQHKLPLEIYTFAGNVTCKFVDCRSLSVLQRVYAKNVLSYIHAKQNRTLM